MTFLGAVKTGLCSFWPKLLFYIQVTSQIKPKQSTEHLPTTALSEIKTPEPQNGANENPLNHKAVL
jgi:hypothetical protein